MATVKAVEIDVLVIDELAGDAQLIGTPETEEIQASQRSGGSADGCRLHVDGRVAHLTGGPAALVLVPERLAVTVKAGRGDIRVLGFCSTIKLGEVFGSLRIAETAGPTYVGDVRGDFRADRVAELTLEGACTGDMRVEDSGSLTAELVSGDLRLISVEEVTLGRVRGDLWMESIGGDVQLGHIDGDVRLSKVLGVVRLQEVAGDLRGQSLSGGLTAREVHGSVALLGPFAAGQEYAISAGGDISIQLDADSDVQLRVAAQGRVRSALDLTPAADGSAIFAATVGRGGARISLTSGGDITIRQHGREEASKQRRDAFAGLGDQIREQVRASLAAAGVPASSGSWAARGRSARPAKSTPSGSGRSDARAPKLDEEMMILNMVERGLLSPEDADRLLQALE
jgi:hypothetical protein